jgi:hypothetical protein
MSMRLDRSRGRSGIVAAEGREPSLIREETTMKLIGTPAAIGFVASGFALSGSLLSEEGAPAIGESAPEINGKAWVNSLGADPSLASLRGQAVLIEFWATW